MKPISFIALSTVAVTLNAGNIQKTKYLKKTVNNVPADVNLTCVQKCGFQSVNFQKSVIEVTDSPCVCTPHTVGWYDDPQMAAGAVYLAMRTAFETFVPPFKVSLGSTYSQSVPFPLETGSSVRAAFTPTEKEFSLNLYLDAENCFLHVVARGGTLLVDQMINNVWQQLLTVGPYPGNIGQMQELKVKIHDNYVQVFLDNVFQIQLNTMLPSAKIRTLTFVNDNDSVVIEIHTMELERL